MVPPNPESETAEPSQPEQGGALPSGQALPPTRESGPESQLLAPYWGLSFYLFAEPFGVGKVVVDLSGGGPGAELLRRAGAVQVLSVVSSGLPLPFPNAAADVVIGALSDAMAADDRERANFFAEIRRILRPEGMCLVRVAASVLARIAAGASARAVLADIVLEHFATVDIVEETPFRAVSFFAPGCDELAVSEAMARVAGKPSHFVALCTPAAERTWQLSESLLVPTGSVDAGEANQTELAAWRAEVTRLTERTEEIAREREALRERQMTLQDSIERQGKSVSTMRKDIERFLRQISDDAAARELLSLERDQVRRKLAQSEAEVEAANCEVYRQKAIAQALRKEVARLRAARGPVGPVTGS
jgi:SAM-dependent methyltransferase